MFVTHIHTSQTDNEEDDYLQEITPDLCVLFFGSVFACF